MTDDDVSPTSPTEPTPIGPAAVDPSDVSPIGVLAAPAGGSQRRTRRSHRRTGRILLVLGVLLLPFVAIAGWLWYQIDPPGTPGRVVVVTIPAGEGVSAIGDRLEARGVIGSAFAFGIYTRVAGHQRFQAGEYRLRRDSGVRAAVAALERGPRQHYVSLALPPGLTFTEISERIGALPGRSAERVRQIAAAGSVRSRFAPSGVTSLEGLTWPDTYAISDHDDETQILTRIVRAFDDHATRLGLAQASDPYHAVIVASLIQREAGIDEDRPKIAAVVENRLRLGMPLQIDATVVYARGGGRAPLTSADFNVVSPYNTYKVTGLPPTPISTVTAASLTAALHPADVPYLYYVLTDASGRHAFAVTFAEHQRNIADSRRRGVIK